MENEITNEDIIKDFNEWTDTIFSVFNQDDACMALAGVIWGQQNKNDEWIPEDELLQLTNFVKQRIIALYILKGLCNGRIHYTFSNETIKMPVNEMIQWCDEIFSRSEL